MAKIITVAHQKGGVGKSTLALNLAYRFSREVKTALTDTDPQGSTMRLKAITTDLNIIQYSSVKELRKMPYNVVFIDTPPYLIDTMLPIFVESDFVLIPTKAGVTDIMAIGATVELVKKAQAENPALKAAIVLNMVKPRAGITAQAKEQLNEFALPLLSEVRDRTSYNNTFLSGGVFASSDKLAQQEIEILSNEILSYL
jgi:chromosome partitioning protein